MKNNKAADMDDKSLKDIFERVAQDQAQGRGPAELLRYIIENRNGLVELLLKHGASVTPEPEEMPSPAKTRKPENSEVIDMLMNISKSLAKDSQGRQQKNTL